MFLSYFHSDGTPPDLHSFPTRRSSDLEPGIKRSETGRAMKTTSSGILVCNAQSELLLCHATGGGYWDIPDRKSTRLNSSHLVISYAVFCLKKKKKHQIM